MKYEIQKVESVNVEGIILIGTLPSRPSRLQGPPFIRDLLFIFYLSEGGLDENKGGLEILVALKRGSCNN